MSERARGPRAALGTALLLAVGCGGLTGAGVDAGADASGAGGRAPVSDAGGGSAGAASRIMTEAGSIVGRLEGTTRVFLGIPYAEPPVGDLRFRPPRPHPAWQRERYAVQRAPPCAQRQPFVASYFKGTEEDCLTLNVWSPAGAKRAPVMVWLHGGSFVVGSGAQPDYDGRKLAEATGTVVVTLNYRLGAFGFLAARVLRQEDEKHPSSGMYGLEDQRAALAWVKANIAALGGDPERVTLFGESAGALSACLHLVSTPSRGLFHRVILESGACSVSKHVTREAAEAQGARLIAALGCDGFDDARTRGCLRRVSTRALVEALPTSALGALAGSTEWWPSVDGLELARPPRELFAAGEFVRVPTILGANADEGTLFFSSGDVVEDDASYQAFAESLAPGHGADIIARYPSSEFASPRQAAARAFGDGFFVCPTRSLARTLARGGAPTFLYHFAHESADPTIPDLGVFHSSELPFVFGNPTAQLPLAPSAHDAPLARLVMGYWGALAAAGDPNGEARLTWPAYEPVSDESLVLDLAPSIASGVAQEACDFWDALEP
ncbi:MAG: carboxylesterase family protein [Sorangiineae bacterium]|nr:carboxylesterase family protein [Polyangiaceae bacterium]MEB2321778.1 carboxylesterase family protein [Sorangiineae bacterium]